MTTRDTGNLGEDIACMFLARKGFKILRRNYLRQPYGEIDIIAEKDNTVRFIEVKTLSREISHRPEDLVTPSKIRKVARTASIYMDETKDSREYQIDVVSVLLNKATHTAKCRLLEQAVEGEL